MSVMRGNFDNFDTAMGVGAAAALTLLDVAWALRPMPSPPSPTPVPGGGPGPGGQGPVGGEGSELVGPEEAARLLEVGPAQVQAMIDEGLLTPVGDGEPRSRRAEVLAVRGLGG